MGQPIPSVMRIHIATLCFCIVSWHAESQHREIDSLENTLTPKNDTAKVVTLVRLADLYQKLDLNKSLELAKEAQTIARRLSFGRGEYAAVFMLSRLHLRNGDGVNTLNATREQLAIAERLNNTRLIAESHRNMATSFDLLGYVPQAFEANVKAHKLYQQIGDQKEMGWVLNEMGNCAQLSANYKDAEKYYLEALAIFKKLDGPDDAIAKVLINLGETIAHTGLYEKSVEYYFEALKQAEQSNNRSTIAYCLLQIAEVYNSMDNYEKAISFYENAIHSYEQVVAEGKPIHRFSKAYGLTGLGKVLLKKKDYAAAQKTFSEALAIATGSDYYPVLTRIYDGLAISNEKLGHFKPAFEYRTLHMVALDSLNSRRQKEKVNELQTRFKAEENEKQIAQLQSEKEWNRIYILLMGGLLLLGLVTVILFIARLRLRIRKDKQIAAKEQERFETEIKAKEITEKQLRQELEFKTSELTTFTLHMIQKNEILEDVKKEVDAIRQVSSDDIRTKINRLLNNINLSQRTDKDWESFKLYFDQVHKGFFDNLKASYPDLNGKDLKLCALLRLNLDTKQIATILDISPDSAKVARHRIRKKIGLTTDDNLYNFLITL